MGLKDSDAVASGGEKGFANSRIPKKRKRNVLVRPQSKFPSSGRASEDDDKSSIVVAKGLAKKKGAKGISVKEDAASVRLVKIELDAAEALAEFSRIALLPTRQKAKENADSGLHWCGKRKRSMRTSKEITSGGAGKEPGLVHDKPSKNAFVPATASLIQMNVFSSQVGYGAPDARKGSCLAVERDDPEEGKAFPESSKESLPSASRAESPSSPLPSSQLECGAFLIGGPAESSAFQRVVPGTPAEKCCTLPMKPKVEGSHIDGPCISTASVHKMSVKRKPRALKHPILPASVKVEQSGDAHSQASSDQQMQDLVVKSFDDNKCQSLIRAESGVESLVNAAPQVQEKFGDVELRVSTSKQKTLLTEVEKEERRLRRIQANRESARQTIRRKQILCEELTKRASTLALENEGMRQKKEMLMQELHTLTDQNCHLKEQFAMHFSSNLGLETLQQACKTSQQVSLPAILVPGLPYGGMPSQSFVWALAVAQATGVNQTAITHDAETLPRIKHSLGTLDTSRLWLGSDGNMGSKSSELFVPHQVSKLSEQQIIGNSNDSSSTAPAQKEISAVSEAHVEGSTIQSTRESSDCHKDCKSPKVDFIDTQVIAESMNGADLEKGLTCLSYIDNGVSSQSVSPFHGSSLKSQACRSAINDICGSVISSAELGQCLGNVTQQLSRALSSFGVPSNGSKAGVALEQSLHTCSFIERKTSAASMAAAEARRRRKELTRSKFLQSRGFKLHC